MFNAMFVSLHLKPSVFEAVNMVLSAFYSC